MNAIPLKPTREKFRELAKQEGVIPVYTELIADCETPVSAFYKLQKENGYSFLLESAEKNDETGRYSFVGCDPQMIFESRDKTVRIVEGASERSYEVKDDPFHELQRLMESYRMEHADKVFEGQKPPFVGGAVGFLAFDVVRFFEPAVGRFPKDDLGLPEMNFMFTETLLVFDHRLRRLKVMVNVRVKSGDNLDEKYEEAGEKIGEILKKLSAPAHLPDINVFKTPSPVVPESNTTRQEYLDMVSSSQEYINAGDIFQIVPSQRFETAYKGDPLTLYRALRFVNPSPYMFCLNFGGKFSLVGSSPEVHARLVNQRVECRPIAGTRRRGADEKEDAFNAQDLLADPKERAEHLMLVDLARNDIGRIADFGSVEVTDFMVIERYSHVMHIVSHVAGNLRKDKNAYDVIRATFPHGTVSGSPKIRAMQIINQNEKNKRGSYAGAIGYFGYDGNLDSCIGLRTVLLKEGKAYVQAGAGVVADSTPEGEYQETVNKAMGMMRAIERANLITEQKS